MVLAFLQVYGAVEGKATSVDVSYDLSVGGSTTWGNILMVGRQTITMSTAGQTYYFPSFCVITATASVLTIKLNAIAVSGGGTLSYSNFSSVIEQLT